MSNRHPGTHRLVSAVARPEAVVRDDPPRPVFAAFARGLGDLTAAIEHIETALAAGETAATDAHFAAERVADIAIALRQRKAEAALCDSLEAAAREVSDATTRSNAAAARASSAVHLLGKLARRVNDMMVRGGPAAPGVAPLAADERMGASDMRRLDDTAHHSRAETIAAHSPDDSAECAHHKLPDMQAKAGLGADADGLRPLLLPIPSPLEGNIETQQTSAPPAVEPRAKANAIARAALNDPLAALRALSEEELIALFS